MLRREHTIALATNGSGACTAYTAGKIRGRIVSLLYTQGTIDNGATVTLTGATTATPIIAHAGNASSPMYPRASLVTTGNAAITDSNDLIPIVAEKIKVVVSSGGDTKSGSVTIVTDE